MLGLVFGLLLFFGEDINKWLFPAAFSIVAMITLGGAAYYLDFPRLIVYGILIALSPLVGEFMYQTWGVLHHGFPITFGISAAVMIIVGVYLFIRFLQRYPLPTEST